MNNYSSIRLPALPDLISLSQLTCDDFEALLGMARELRANGSVVRPLEGKSIALIFEKPSLRTRFTFEVGIRQLGGWPIFQESTEARLGVRESVADVGRNLSLWVNAIVARVFSHRSLEELALFASVPVVNALSDEEHPCQALADLLTLSDVWPSFQGKQLVYVGDWNNVARSLAHACALARLHFRAVCPEGYGPGSQENVTWSPDPDSVRGADAIYTDVWASMGQEGELAERFKVFHRYQVNDRLMAQTEKPALFMHCLPAHRGHEVTDSVIESAASLALRQAANRLPIEKAILTTLLEDKQ